MISHSLLNTFSAQNLKQPRRLSAVCLSVTLSLNHTPSPVIHPFIRLSFVISFTRRAGLRRATSLLARLISYLVVCLINVSTANELSWTHCVRKLAEISLGREKLVSGRGSSGGRGNVFLPFSMRLSAKGNAQLMLSLLFRLRLLLLLWLL